MNTQQAQVSAAVQIVVAVAEAIRDLGSVPSGHLYAQLMGYMSLDQYQKVIDLLKKQGIVKESGNLLTYTGPKKVSA